MCQFIYFFQEALFRLNNSEVADNRLDENRRDFTAPFIKGRFIAFDIIKWNCDHFVGNAFWYTG